MAPQPPETVRIIRVFVSCPSDVEKEVELLKGEVERFNRLDGDDYGVRLELWRWKNNAPHLLGPGPQETIQKALPDYHIYFGIMWARLGTPTGGFASGTVAEYHDAVDRKKKNNKLAIVFFFNSQPTPTNKPSDLIDHAKVREFRESLTGLTNDYQGVDDFKDRAYEQLRHIVRELVGPPGGAAAGAKKPSVPAPYCKWLRNQCKDIELMGLKLKQGQVTRLSSVYVPLTTPEKKRDEQNRDGGRRDAALRDPGEREKPPTLLLDLLGEESLYVSGDPGSGKSTFCRWATLIALDNQVPALVGDAEEFHEELPDSLHDRLPLLIRLRDFWEFLPKSAGQRELSRSELEASLADWLESKHLESLNWTTVRAHLANGSAFLIFDGTDEVPRSHGEAPHACAPREMLISGLCKAIPRWQQAGNRLLITGRPYGLTPKEVDDLALRPVRIGDLPEPLQKLLVKRWFAMLMFDEDGDPKAAGDTAAKMLGVLASRNDLQALTANPMLLTAMCVIYTHGKRLPQDMHDLYQQIVDNVLFNRFPHDRTAIDPVRRRLEVIAYGMHTGEGLKQERLTPEAETTYDEIDAWLSAYETEIESAEPGFHDVEKTRNLLIEQTGLLLPRDEHKAGYYHFSIQEFLTAVRCASLEGAGGAERWAQIFAYRARVPEWHNTLSFFFRALLANDLTQRHIRPLLDRLVSLLRPLDETLGLQIVLADCLQTYQRKPATLKPQWLDEFRQACLSAIAREVPLRERQRLGLALGELGDPRIAADLRDPHAVDALGRPAYIEIPAGKYLLGDKKKPWKLEKSFLLSRYPVTNSQYELFLNDNGYEKEQFWSPEGWAWREKERVSEPLYRGSAKWNNASQPVVSVSFFEAEAFCKWAGGRLPGENEWEAAARGPQGYEYPWGNAWEDGICNSSEAELGCTSPVGLFPRAKSKDFELEDMAGNVWEWCADWFDDRPSYRVMRGGCWYRDARSCRSAYRGWREPGYRDAILGFRLAPVQSS